MSYDSIASLFGQIAVAAGQPIMQIRERGFATAFKPDSSPVTEADLAAERLILERLAVGLPDVPVVAEECAAAGRVPGIGNRFVVVDPLDGTREFVEGRGEFTVNLALVEGGRPVVGAIYAPVLGQLWFAGDTARTIHIAPGATLDATAASPIHVRRPPAAGLTALVSRSHLDPESEAYLARHQVVERRALGSSLKFCFLAQGDADLYPRFGSICEWDTAAGVAILTAAGGAVTAPDGTPLQYGNRAAGFRHQTFVACGGVRVRGDQIISAA